MPQGGTRISLSGRVQAAFQPGWGSFSPGLPLTPPDPQPVRTFDFPVGVNSVLRTRDTSSFGFPELRAFSNVELIRLAIETRKDQIERLGWSVKSREGRRSRADAQTRVNKAEKFLRKPDGVTHFATWLRLALEDLFVLDAPAFEKRRNRGGDLIGLDVVPGDTIKVLVDETGRRPRAPVPGFQQVIKGRVWADLTDEELLYLPRNPRPNHLYGFGPVEQIVVTINTLLRRQTAQLSYFTESNLPAGLVTAPEGWTAEHIKEYQNWFDSRLAGNQAERSRLIWGPASAKYQAFKESPIKDEFDEWLARIVCFAFSLPPTPFIKQMNRATSESDQERAIEEGLGPLLLWAKRLFDGVIQDDLGFHDLEFVWEIGKSESADQQAKIHDLYLKNGSLTINEVRDDLGRDPIPGGDEPRIYTSRGAMPLDALDEVEPGQPVPDPPAEGGQEPDDQPAATGDKSKAGKEPKPQ